jgi:uncharacterized protein GlcG (DUF336 family)
MLYSQTSVSSDTAAALVADAAARAASEGWGVAIAVVDVQGVLLAFQRLDGVPPPIVDFAIDKAFTAATMKRATTAFAERMSSTPSLSLGLSTRPRLLAWGGGLPVVRDGVCVGGIGVSGARDVEDVACAAGALAALGFDPVE